MEVHHGLKQATIDDEMRWAPSVKNGMNMRQDYARLIQSPAFRRLQGKSQVFGAGSGDYYRTRLTHSLEVSQIAREVADGWASNMSFCAEEHPGLISIRRSWNCRAGA